MFIQDLLVYLYMILEQYVFARCLDSWHEAKHAETNQFFTRMQTLEADYCNKEQRNFSFAPATKRKDVQVSSIDAATYDLFESITASLNEEVVEHPLPEYNEPDQRDNPYLSMQDLEEVSFQMNVNVPSYISAKIADNIQGAQQWVVKVIGMEDEYIHVTDGKRIWVNIGEQALMVQMGDVLLMDVSKEDKNIIVERMFTLEQSVTEDYKIPDESILSSQQESVAV